MRKPFLLSLALLGGTLAANAQTTPPPPANVGVQRVRVSAAEMNPERDAARDTDLLAGQLSLSPEQATRVQAAALTRHQDRRALLVKHNAMRDHSKLPEESAAIETQYEARLQAILTPAQEERRQMIRARFRKIREQAELEGKIAPIPAARP